MAYEINYEDQRFQDVESDKKNAINEVDKTYGEMIDKSGDFYQEQIDATNEWEKKQTELQNQQTEFAISEIEQKKDQAKKDYTKEQSGAYVDWQKQSNEFGAEAEQRAAQGMANTGFSESSQVAMFNSYQTRVVAAIETFSRIVQDFDNDITQARLQNNAALAEIAYNSLQKRLELNLQGFNQKNQLLLELANKKTELDQMYHERWQDVLDQMNAENALAEEIRQFNESMDWEKYQFNYKNKLGEFAVTSSGGGGGGSSSTRSSNPTPSPQIDKTEDKAERVGDETNVGNSASKAAWSKMQLNNAIKEGASKDKVANAISVAERNGVISKAEATELRKTYTPRGVQY